MTEKQKFESIGKLVDKLKQQRKTGTFVFESMDEKLLLKDLYMRTHNAFQVDMSCSACVMHYLNMSESYYEREHPKYLSKNEAIQTEVTKPKPKRKKDKSNEGK